MAPVEDVLRSVVTTMSENMVETWTTTELYSMYIAASGIVTRRQFLSSITDYFSDELLVLHRLHIEGCENVLLYYVVWPVSGTTENLAASFGPRLSRYPPVSKKIVLFYRYGQEATSVKDHERTRRGRAKEIHITLCSYMLKAVEEGARTIRILSDDTDVFVLLVYWTSKIQVSAKIEMEKMKWC
ncbi:hypothetical protein GQR58_001992 [Nymphon striatum]|nr:hypothetical protein GQR58_001992 [Nymphon striatum]